MIGLARCARTMQQHPGRKPVEEILVNGVLLHYLEMGKGDAIIFVHGSLNDFRAWQSQVSVFAQRYRVIAYSRRYHYPNAWTGDGLDYSAALHAEDLAALIQTLDLGRAHLVGSSYGAYVSMLLARRRPELVRTLVLGEPPLIPWLTDLPGGDAIAASFMAGIWEPARRAFEKGDTEKGVRTFINGVLGEGKYDQLPASVQATMIENAPALKAETTATNLFSSFTCEDAQHTTAPTLLLTGELSPRMFHLMTDQLAKCLPQCERATIPDASHAMHAEKPSGYNATLMRFLSWH